MSQILKDSARILIVDSAIDDLYENGYNGASMRRIAVKANMTVGNLYRYFKNKDELVNFIIEPVMDKINKVLLRNTNQSFDLNSHLFDINKLSIEDFYKTFDDIAVELCNLYFEHPKVFIIVLKSPYINERFLMWFVDKIKEYIHYHMKFKEDKKIDVLSRMYGISLFSALQDFFINNMLEKDDIVDILRLYFKTWISYVEMNLKQWEA